MFVGHYGPAAAVAGNHVKLWHGFVAVQFLDILWAPLVLMDIEKVRIVEGFTNSNHFDLYFVPYTHSLLMAIVWSIAAGLLYAFVRAKSGLIGGLIIALLVFSHWIADWLMHIPDLPLYFGGPKVGLGLWQNRSVSVALEIFLLIAGFMIYLSRTRSKNMQGAMIPLFSIAIIIAAQLYGNFGPPPPSADAAAITALACYILFTILAVFTDATRTAK